MITSLVVLSFIFGFLGVHAPYWSTFFPRLGLFPIAHYHLLRWVTLGLDLIITLTVFLLFPSWATGSALVLVFVWWSLGLFFVFSKIFVVLDQSLHVLSSEAPIKPEDIVIGLEWNKEACAWPLREMVLPRHLVHDTLGGLPILVSYCGACRSPMIYSNLVNGKILHFEVEGVWRRNLIMRDHETKTLWQQATGEAVYGLLKGTQLEFLGGEQMKWSVWKKNNPKTFLAVDPPDRPFDGRIPKSWMIWILEHMTPHTISPGLSQKNQALDMHEEVAGLSIEGFHKAYCLKTLREKRIVHDHVGSFPVMVLYDEKADGVRAFSRRLGEGSVFDFIYESDQISSLDRKMIWDDWGRPLSGTNQVLTPLNIDRQWWLGWSEFHPETTVYRGR
ncbi:MAG: DUF3179 domain-containing protein [Chlamydiae bacterium]|nr:DUF3179 domain-containing protein [Chlamydiota bacterium]MBI3278028.1 DUF3179 domain-containing protein [Chlamydiota bacterium]